MTQLLVDLGALWLMFVGWYAFCGYEAREIRQDRDPTDPRLQHFEVGEGGRLISVTARAARVGCPA
jgi:hypothetical protein